MDKHEEAARKQSLAAAYGNAVRVRAERIRASLSAAQYDFFKPVMQAADTTIVSDLVDAMRKPDSVPSAYVSQRLGWMFGGAVPNRNKEIIRYFADRLQEYPYADSLRRRSFRARYNEAYAYKLIGMIRNCSFADPTVIDEPLESILNRELPEDAQAYLDAYAWRGCGYNGWQIAYALDRRDGRIEEAVRRILTEENGSGRMTDQLVRGVLFSHRSEFHELLGQLLLAARLQEGLRQVICENADCGTKAGFLTILKVIAENHLIRFSSVKRAVGTWLGILTEEAHSLERISEKSVRLIMDCFNSVTAREDYLASEDAMKVYIALWSYGFDDVHEAIQKIVYISENGSRHQLLVAGYFTANLDLPYVSNTIAKTVLKQHGDKDDILAVWLPCFLSARVSAVSEAAAKDRRAEYNAWFDNRAELDEYYQLIGRLYAVFSGKTKTFSPCVFPWHTATVAKSDLAEVLCTLAALSGDNDKLDEACRLIKECNANQREFYFRALLCKPKTVLQRRTVLEGLADREMYTRRTAYRLVSELQLSCEEYRLLEELLRLKAADIRKHVMALLLRQSDAELTACISRLLENGKEEVRLGGLDMLLQLKNEAKRKVLVDSFHAVLFKMAKADNLPSKERILLESLLPEINGASTQAVALFSEKDMYSPVEFDAEYTERCAKTFSLYFPESRLPELIRHRKSGFRLLETIKSTFVKSTACSTAVAAAADLMSLSRFIEAHKTDSFVNGMGETILLGNVQFLHHIQGKDGEFLLHDLLNEWLETNAITPKRLVGMMVLYHAYIQKTQFSEACADTIRTVFGAGFEYGKALPFAAVVAIVLNHLRSCLPQDRLVLLASALTIWFVHCVPDEQVMVCAPSPIERSDHLEAHLLAHRQLLPVYRWLSCENDTNLKNTFPLAVASAQRCVTAYKRYLERLQTKEKSLYDRLADKSPRSLCLPFTDLYRANDLLVGADAYLYAAYQGLITEAQLYAFLLDPDNVFAALEVVTTVASGFYEKGKQIAGHGFYKAIRSARKVKEFLGSDDEPTEEAVKLVKFVCRVYDNILPVVLASELSRGESPAAYTKGIRGIARIYGAQWFAKILESMGNDTMERSACYGWGDPRNRRSSLSYLLSVCIPSDEDSAQTLRAALVGKKISTKRLVEAALYSPEWIAIIGTYFGIESFESACYYFMAHMNERFDDKRKAVIARFTPLSEDELNLGAFDVNWFRSAYEAVGEKDFERIYDAAKYISDGAKHSRARKYADATLGRLDVSETENRVSDKRNKDLLMAYALIPLENEADLSRRYMFIQRFRKESKRFGSQRMASEGKAVEMALKNLAINAGYSDAMRLTLRMEAKVIDDSRSLLEEQLVEGVSFRITLDKNGKASLTCAKDGKPLKSVPVRLKKHETVLALIALVKTLVEQYRRVRGMLEQALVDGTAFTFGELLALSAHPVADPMLQNLVLISSDAVGFLSDEGLVDDTGTLHPLENRAAVMIAHPFDLYSRGCWRNYQQYLFDNRIVQPVRQVFRELYIKTADEMDSYHTLRYAGNQIQPAKTVGALKSRRWVADVENGLQKVYYSENIVAQIYALADWFSPADIEAPTLEWVCFTNRKTGEAVRIADVPDRVFSEVMRDVDLAVSVAHAGGVDPETSHSTVEMRAAILSFVLPMFRIKNVRVEGSHAIVNGKLAEYSIHLGSGVVHQLGGAMIPVLPVHSQHRGKVFLPFVDDDPKTAEIVSKVLLFAEDDKIKDPMILAGIRR